VFAERKGLEIDGKHSSILYCQDLLETLTKKIDQLELVFAVICLPLWALGMSSQVSIRTLIGNNFMHLVKI
jgi:hypothetical protein